MSNFFEQELRKLFGDGEIIHDPVFVGRACVGGLDAGRQVRAEFVTMGHADHYEALRLTLLDNDLGVVDKLTLRLKDLWGKKEIPNNPYLKSGVDPHIWVNDGKTDWYAYHPTPADYQVLRQAASDYLSAFRERTPDRWSLQESGIHPEKLPHPGKKQSQAESISHHRCRRFRWKGLRSLRPPAQIAAVPPLCCCRKASSVDQPG